MIVPCNNECEVLTLHGQLQQPSEAQAPSESYAPSEMTVPSVTTEARSERLKEVQEFIQRPVDPGAGAAYCFAEQRKILPEILLVVRVQANRRSQRRYVFCLKCSMHI